MDGARVPGQQDGAELPSWGTSQQAAAFTGEKDPSPAIPLQTTGPAHHQVPPSSLNIMSAPVPSLAQGILSTLPGVFGGSTLH